MHFFKPIEFTNTTEVINIQYNSHDKNISVYYTM